ncbi:hypothetical protein DFH09DRAFT_1104340 [Mycena vulgaris]|nr:hypothetical protein DFH09DRAFT_1104340 [Mycena vulgaris]
MQLDKAGARSFVEGSWAHAPLARAAAAGCTLHWRGQRELFGLGARSVRAAQRTLVEGSVQAQPDGNATHGRERRPGARSSGGDELRRRRGEMVVVRERAATWRFPRQHGNMWCRTGHGTGTGRPPPPVSTVGELDKYATRVPRKRQKAKLAVPQL